MFGILGGIGPHPDDVAHMKRTADRLFGDQYRWSVLGAGRNQLPIAAMSAAMGGNVRVGLEDSLWLGPGKLAESNAAQVRAVRQIIEGWALAIATPDEAREILKLKGRRDGGILIALRHRPPRWRVLQSGRPLPASGSDLPEEEQDYQNDNDQPDTSGGSSTPSSCCVPTLATRPPEPG